VIDANELAKLWREHSARLLVIARAWGDLGEDGVQEAFVALATQQRLPDDPLAWLVRAMRNQMLQWYRSGKRRDERHKKSADTTSWFCNQTKLEDGLDARLVTAWLSELAPGEREVIVLHLWGQMSFRQIAEVTESSSATVHRHYAQGLESLRKRANRQHVS
jgi:RNA polymerase sigma-70 factor (ECF subfamily)